MTHSRLDRDARVLVAGHRGLAGSAVYRLLEREGFNALSGASSADVDFRDRDATFDFFKRREPEVVVLAAAKVGGILANDRYRTEFLSENLRIQVNVLDAALAHGTERLLFLGSSCIYPKFAPQPISEDALLTGTLEPTNDAYAIAKIAGIIQIQAMRKQYGKRFISAMPTNLYGPGDNFNRETAHVLASLLRRYHEAVTEGAPSVTNWGSGSPQREFLHVDDLASACLFLLENYDGDEPVNVGVGADHTIKEIAQLVADTVGFKGETQWDTSYPDGTPRKLLNVEKLTELGWTASIGFEAGLKSTYEWFVQNAS